MKPLRILCVLCVLCGSMFALDRTAFTFVQYNMQVRVDPAGEAMAVRGTVLLRNDSSAPQTELPMQISSSLEWRLVHIGGKDVQYSYNVYVTDTDHTGKVNELVIQLPTPVPPKGTVEVEVGYSGQITSDAARLTAAGVPAATAAHTDWDHIGEPVTALRGAGYVTWYPVEIEAAKLSDPEYFSTLADWKEREQGSTMKADLCWINDEQELTVVANGTFEGLNRQVLGATDETATHAGCSQYSYANLGATTPAFAMAQYNTLSRPLIDVFHLAGDASFAQEYALAAENVEPLDARWFGKPRQKVSVVQLAQPGDAPYELQTFLLTPLHTLDREALQARMMHELVHASLWSPRPWIDEGLAHFGMALLQAERGRESAVSYMDQFLPALQQAEKQPAAHGLAISHDEIMYRAKAMFVWWMLRDIVGDAALQKAISLYRPTDDQSPTYLPDLISQAAHKDLSWFFNDWVYRDRGLPDFHIVSAYPRKTLSNVYVVAVTVENLGAVSAEVPVIVHTAQGDRSSRVMVPAHDKGVVRVEVPDVPTEVVVNDGSVPESDLKNNSLAIPQTSAQ